MNLWRRRISLVSNILILRLMVRSELLVQLGKIKKCIVLRSLLFTLLTIKKIHEMTVSFSYLNVTVKDIIRLHKPMKTDNNESRSEAIQKQFFFFFTLPSIIPWNQYDFKIQWIIQIIRIIRQQFPVKEFYEILLPVLPVRTAGTFASKKLIVISSWRIATSLKVCTTL